MNNDNQTPESDEIDLMELLQNAWKGRVIAIKMSAVFTLLGILYALSITNLYMATTTFIPKGQGSGLVGGNLNGLASLAGINLSMSGDNSEISPSLYPMLIKSNPFIETLLKVKVPKDGILIKLQDYLSESNSTPSILKNLKKYTIGLPSLIKTSLSNESNNIAVLDSTGIIKKLTLKEESIYKSANELITLSIDKNEGFVTLNVLVDNPEVAAIVALNAKNLLQKEVIDFKIKNAKKLLTFTEDLYKRKKVVFEALQDELAAFQDQNQNISSGLFQNKLSRLQAEFTIARSVNEELARQVEQARIQVSKDTPTFTVIEPVIIPNQRTSPKRTIIVLVFSFLGIFLGLGYTLIKEPFAKIRKEITLDNKTKKNNSDLFL